MEKNNNYHGYIYPAYTWLDWENIFKGIHPCNMTGCFEPKEVIFQDQKSTTIIWNDGSKTTVTITENDEFNEEIGFAMALVKKIYGGRSNFIRMLKKKSHYRLSSKNKKLKKENNSLNNLMDVITDFKLEKSGDNIE